jgi:pSer/pThr/pTyr-binding forkhead associated (FHA) protein
MVSAYLQILGRLDRIEVGGLAVLRRGADELWALLVDAPVAIGRARADGPFLSVSHDTVSRRHCVLEPADGAWILRDVASCGGTFVNNDRLVRRSPGWVLQPGDVIHLGAPSGSSKAIFRRELPPA